MASCVFAQSPEKFKIVKTGEFEGAIILKEQGRSEYFGKNIKAFWTPTEQNVLDAEKLAQAYLEKYHRNDNYHNMSVKHILSQLKKYKRQYVGLIDENGDKSVWINYFHDSGDFPQWDQQLVEVNDGGDNFFNIKVNLNKKNSYDLSINGVA